MIRRYDWTISDAYLSPDGFEKRMIVVNGQYPGPLIEANWGDWIEVTVTNNRSEGSSIHWHGFLQTGTPYMDGTPGISQCPIAPGATFTYRFRAELYGTSWWHGHYSAQYIDGLVGPMVVHGPISTPYDIDLGPVIVSDWFHGYYEDLVSQIQVAAPVGPGVHPPQSENVLINGKANFNCSIKGNYLPDPVNGTCIENAGLAEFKVQSGKKHLLRFINTAAEGVLFVSIDGHQLEVVAQDFVPLVPYNTSYLTLAVGQRNDVIFYATGAPTDSVWLRVVSGPPGNIPGPFGGIQPPGQGGCNIGSGVNNFTTAAIFYEDADTSIPPNTTSDIPIQPSYIAPFACQNDPLNMTVPFYPIPYVEADLKLDIIITGGVNETGQFVWWMNNVTYLGDFNDPLLLEAKMGQVIYNEFRAMNDWSKSKSVRLNVTATGFPAIHPMHVHGHNMQILSSGIGYWKGEIENPENPTRRDVWSLPPLGYTVFQWDLNNPGVW
jgi:FtsP/CotA-like multicopper oxidase with cupredoxin domain